MAIYPQIAAFNAKYPKDRLQGLGFTFMDKTGQRTPMMFGTERRVLEAFAAAIDKNGMIIAEAENSDGYFTLDRHVMECDCGEGLRCCKADSQP